MSAKLSDNAWDHLVSINGISAYGGLSGKCPLG